MSRGYVLSTSTPERVWWGVYTGVDFGCFSTKYGDCEALEEREEQTDFTLFLCIPSPEGVRGEIKINTNENVY